jgi:hypothetical protein
MVFDAEHAQELLAYCFTEIIRNVFEHADVDGCIIMGQKYASHVVEIAVLDVGRGIYASLREGYPNLERARALMRAVEPGISLTRSVARKGSDLNAGFGLYVLSELGRRHGEFKLWSGDYLLTVSRTARRTAPLLSRGRR